MTMAWTGRFVDPNAVLICVHPHTHTHTDARAHTHVVSVPYQRLHVTPRLRYGSTVSVPPHRFLCIAISWFGTSCAPPPIPLRVDRVPLTPTSSEDPT